MRGLTLLAFVLCASAPASAQLVQPLRVDLGAGAGYAAGPTVNRYALVGTADLQVGVPTLRFRGVRATPILDAETRMEGAAMLGATLHAQEGTFFFGAGPARYRATVSNRPGVDSESGWGVAVSADAYYALSSTTRLGMQAFATFGEENLRGVDSNIRGVAASIRFGK